MLQPVLDWVRGRLGGPVSRVAAWRAQAAARGERRDFAGALAVPGLSIIAEVNRRSPSAGPLEEGLDPTALARGDAAGGASALSVLTEPDHFHGSRAELARARAACSLPVLRRGFLLHPAQVWEAEAAGPMPCCPSPQCSTTRGWPRPWLRRKRPNWPPWWRCTMRRGSGGPRRPEPAWQG